MVKIVKKGDNYKPDKLKRSILRAGASDETADKIVSSVKVYDGMQTLELRNQVTALLRLLDPAAADKYESYDKSIRLVKRGDTYQPEKLKESILRTGTSEKIADSVVNSVKVYDGMSTLELRWQVIEKLKQVDAKAAQTYTSFKTPAIAKMA